MSQENIALGFLNSTQWNQDLISRAFGPAACIFGGGSHDARVPRASLGRFAANVKWCLRLLHPTCGHVTWVANAAPDPKTQHLHPQTHNDTSEWSAAIRHTLESTLDFRHKSTVVDAFDASIRFPHKVNVPVDHTLCKGLGEFFESLITTSPSENK